MAQADRETHAGEDHGLDHFSAGVFEYHVEFDIELARARSITDE